MNTSEQARATTAVAEGDKLKAYPDASGKWTIGRGFIFMPNGEPVKPGDTITPEEDEQMWQNAWSIRDKQEYAITGLLPQNKFDAVGMFIYNEGIGRFMGSTLHKMIVADMNDINIPSEFQKWIYEKINDIETIMGGLVLRRGQEIAFWNNCTLAEVATKWPLLKEWMLKENIS